MAWIIPGVEADFDGDVLDEILARSAMRRQRRRRMVAGLASERAEPANVLRVLCRFGFVAAFVGALSAFGAAAASTQLRQHPCNPLRARAESRGTLLHAAVLSESRNMVAAVLAALPHNTHVDRPDSRGETAL